MQPHAPKPRRRITPVAVSPAAPAVAVVPVVPAAVAACAPAAAPTSAPDTLDAHDRAVKAALTHLRDDADGLLESQFLPTKEELRGLKGAVKAVRTAVKRYEAAAAQAKEAAAAERARLVVTLLPVRIERTPATRRLYTKHKAATGNETRFLYKCPLADEQGVCALGNASRPFHPAMRSNVVAHIARFHLPKDPLRDFQHDDAFWDHGAEAQRSRTRRCTA